MPLSKYSTMAEAKTKMEEFPAKFNRPWKELLAEKYPRLLRSKLLWQVWVQRHRILKIYIWTRTPTLNPWWLKVML